MEAGEGRAGGREGAGGGLDAIFGGGGSDAAPLLGDLRGVGGWGLLGITPSAAFCGGILSCGGGWSWTVTCCAAGKSTAFQFDLPCLGLWTEDVLHLLNTIRPFPPVFDQFFLLKPYVESQLCKSAGLPHTNVCPQSSTQDCTIIPAPSKASRRCLNPTSTTP